MLMFNQGNSDYKMKHIGNTESCEDGVVETLAPPALRVRGLSVSFRVDGAEVPAVRHVDLDVPRGELVALLGESGSGKSVTARAVMGLPGPGARVSADELTLGRALSGRRTV